MKRDSPRVREKTREILQALAAGMVEPWMIAAAREVAPAFVARKGPTKAAILSLAHVKTRRAQEEAEESAAKTRMHSEVWAWNLAHGGRCDCGCGYRFRHRREGECDHWIERSQGGEHTRENGWRITGACHRAKTDNAPSRRAWNEKRKAYCAAAGIPFDPRKER